jgi:hypothetical protein
LSDLWQEVAVWEFGFVRAVSEIVAFFKRMLHEHYDGQVLTAFFFIPLELELRRIFSFVVYVRMS